MVIWASMIVIVNGQERLFSELPAESNLSVVISALGLQGDRIAVEHNAEIVPRKAWETTPISSGDKLEIVHFVGGGAQ
jgi:sulfur carrier protein